MAQPGSAEVLGTSGRRFESCYPDQTTWIRPARLARRSRGCDLHWRPLFDRETVKTIDDDIVSMSCSVDDLRENRMDDFFGLCFRRVIASNVILERLCSVPPQGLRSNGNLLEG
jgi:hypothetical protein